MRIQLDSETAKQLDANLKAKPETLDNLKAAYLAGPRTVEALTDLLAAEFTRLTKETKCHTPNAI